MTLRPRAAQTLIRYVAWHDGMVQIARFLGNKTNCDALPLNFEQWVAIAVSKPFGVKRIWCRTLCSHCFFREQMVSANKCYPVLNEARTTVGCSP